MVSAICQAKDPRTCKYHGAVIRMNEAIVAKDFNEYYLARKAVEETENSGWVEESYREALGDMLTSPSSPEPILNSSSHAAQTGIVLNKIQVTLPGYSETNAPIFVRHDRNDDDTFPEGTNHIRVQFEREIDPTETRKLAQILGYSYRTTVAGESLNEPYQDTPYSFVVFADLTKSRRDDYGQAIDDLEESFPHLIEHGSPVRTTNRAGAGTKGTKLIDGLEEKLNVHFYYA